MNKPRVQENFCKTCGYCVAVGECPCAKASFAAFFNNSFLNLCQDFLKVTGLIFQVKAKGTGITHEG